MHKLTVFFNWTDEPWSMKPYGVEFIFSDTTLAVNVPPYLAQFGKVTKIEFPKHQPITEEEIMVAAKEGRFIP